MPILAPSYLSTSRGVLWCQTTNKGLSQIRAKPQTKKGEATKIRGEGRQISPIFNKSKSGTYSGVSMMGVSPLLLVESHLIFRCPWSFLVRRCDLGVILANFPKIVPRSGCLIGVLSLVLNSLADGRYL